MHDEKFLFRKEAVAAYGLGGYGSARIPVTISSWLVVLIASLLTGLLVVFLLLYKVELRTNIVVQPLPLDAERVLILVAKGFENDLVAAPVLATHGKNAAFTPVSGFYLKCNALAGENPLAAHGKPDNGYTAIACRSLAPGIQIQNIRILTLSIINRVPVWKAISPGERKR